MIASMRTRTALALAVLAVLVAGLAWFAAPGGIEGQFSTTVAVSGNEFSAAEEFGEGG